MDILKANELFTKTFFRSIQRFNEIITFRRTSKMGFSQALNSVQQESYQTAMEFYHDVKYKDIFIDKEGVFKAAGGIQGLAKKLTEQQFKSYQKSIDEASVVLAHSALDSAAFEYCRVIELIAPPEKWMTNIKNKKATISEINETGYDVLIQQKISKFVASLDRGSLLEKINQLFKLCEPSNAFDPIKDYKFNKERIEKFDLMRHKIVHEEGLTSPLQNCDKEIIYMMDTSNFLMSLVNHRYNLKIDPLVASDIYKEKNV